MSRQDIEHVSPHETVERDEKGKVKLRRVGYGINRRDAAGKLTPSDWTLKDRAVDDPPGLVKKISNAHIKSGYYGRVDGDWPVAFKQGDVTVRTRPDSLGWWDGTTWTVAEAAQGSAFEEKGGKPTYARTFPSADLSYQTRGGFAQDCLLYALPGPAAGALFGVRTELAPDVALVVNGVPYAGGTIEALGAIEIVGTDLFFELIPVRDAAGALAPVRYWIQADAGKTYFIEAAETAWLTAVDEFETTERGERFISKPGRVWPVLFDYTTAGSALGADTTWGPNETVWVNGAVNIGAHQLTILGPGTAVKFSDSVGYIALNNASKNLTVMGTATSPVVFTHEEDTSVGEDTGGGGLTWDDVTYAFLSGTVHSSGTVSLAHVEVRYLRYFLYLQNSATTLTLENARSTLMEDGALIEETTSGAAHTITATNCVAAHARAFALESATANLTDIVIVNASSAYTACMSLNNCGGTLKNIWLNGTNYGATAALYLYGSSNPSIYNLTISGGVGDGVRVANTAAPSIYDSIITCMGAIGVNNLGTGTVTLDHSYVDFIGTSRTANTGGGALTETNRITDGGQATFAGFEFRFETDPIPMFLMSTSPCLAAGSRTYTTAGMVGYTTSKHGTPRAGGATIDLGYHHKISRMPRVER